MSVASSEDAHGTMSSFVSALGGQDKETLDAYLAHLGFVGDEMAAGLGGLFVNSFPEVPSLDEIEVGFTFSKNDVLQLAAHLEVPALPLVQAAAKGSAKDVINKVLALIGDAYVTFLSSFSSDPAAGSLAPTSSSDQSVFRTPGDSASPVAVQSPRNLALRVAGVEPVRSARDLITRSEEAPGDDAVAAAERAASAEAARAACGVQVELAKRAYEDALRAQAVTAGAPAPEIPRSQGLSVHANMLVGDVFIFDDGDLHFTHRKAKGLSGRVEAADWLWPADSCPDLLRALTFWLRLRSLLRLLPGACERMWRLPWEKPGFTTSRLRTVLADTLSSLNRRPPPGRKWTLHCIRAGPASECNALGIPLSRIRRQGGWGPKSDVPSKKYIDPSCPPSAAGRRFFDWLTPGGHLRRLGAS